MRLAKPIALHIAQGTAKPERIKERLERGELRPKKLGVGGHPSYFDSDERDEWDLIAKNPDMKLVLTETDRNTLERYCVLVVRYRRNERAGRPGTPWEKQKKPKMNSNAYFGKMDLEDLRHCITKLGLNPVDRTRLRDSSFQKTANEKDGWDAV